MAETDPELPNPTRRDRAPTITIDTSAVSLASDMKPLPLQLLPNESRSSQDDQATATLSEPNVQSTNISPIELKPAPSFESRPTSPHNVSSPASRGNDRSNAYLSVPGKHSAGNSLDWEDGSRTSSSYGGETFLSDPPASLQGAGHHRLDVDGGVEAILHDEHALQPDPGTEGDFSLEDNKFAYTIGHMTKLFNPKSLAAFYALGGLKGIEKGLRSDIRSGLSLDETTLSGYVTFDEAKAAPFNDSKPQNADIPSPVRTDTQTATSRLGRRPDESFADRRRVFKENRLPEKKTKNILELAWIAYNDNVLILLTIAAVISLGLGLYQALGQPHKNGEARVEWVEGVAIMAAVIIVVVVGAANDWQKERQFVKLNKKKEDRIVKVIRSGKPREISVFDLLVGDVMILEPGDLVPVDGIFIGGHNVKCDESSATGESDLQRKRGAEEVFRAIENREEVRALDPFIISGSKVSEGTGTFLVTAVGVNSSYGKTMMALNEDTEVTPLQKKLNVLAEYIAKLGGAAALLLFIVVFIKFLVQLRGSTATASEKGQNFLQILIVAITVVVVAVPEGLPLAVTLALAFATTRMLKDNNLVRHLRACETMGNATTVCSDKTGTLTQNKMTVVAGSVGTVMRFGDSGVSTLVGGKEVDDHSTADFLSVLSEDVKLLLMRSIAINSTAFEGEQDGQQVFIGSRTETALLLFARNHLGMGPVQEEHANAKIAQVVPFDSARKCMASIVKLDDGRYRMYVKGASEILLEKCDKIIRDPSADISDTILTKDNHEALSRIISTYASRSLRTIALLYRDFEQWPPKDARVLEDDPTQANFDSVFNEMTFLAIVGIQDPLREGVKEAVLDCQKAGVKVRMVTGDNIMTARAIAEECGIFTAGGLVMEGPKFRKLSRTEMDHAIPRLQVLARSSPEDKRILVKRLKELGETVAVTGDGTNDAPALKTADVGFSMGIAGTEVAKEASAIILMDDNFSSIVKAIMWGRAVNDAVKKFLQVRIPLVHHN
jgi:P-type Ca2+ transporter type 2C